MSLRIYTYSYADDDGAPWRGVIINPELWMRPMEPGEPDPDDESEGCLYFSGERFPLRRSEVVLVTGTDLEGAPVRIQVDGWRARIMQHEFDHLDGVLDADRLGDSDWKTVQKIARKRGWGVPVRSGPRVSTTWSPEPERGTAPEWSPGPFAPPLGLEPRTYRLTADCSAN